MTRVVVIGPYPPTPDPLGDRVLGRVREMRGEGVRVDVVSPQPSAAGHHGRPDTVAGATRIAHVVRGADHVVWFGPDRRAAWPLRRALAAVPRVECVAAGPGPPPAGRAPVSAPREGAGFGGRVARLRAGAPTLVRTIIADARRNRR